MTIVDFGKAIVPGTEPKTLEEAQSLTTPPLGLNLFELFLSGGILSSVGGLPHKKSKTERDCPNPKTLIRQFRAFELVTGSTMLVSRTIDCWALGANVMWLLRGRPPFSALAIEGNLDGALMRDALRRFRPC